MTMFVTIFTQNSQQDLYTLGAKEISYIRIMVINLLSYALRKCSERSTSKQPQFPGYRIHCRFISCQAINFGSCRAKQFHIEIGKMYTVMKRRMRSKPGPIARTVFDPAETCKKRPQLFKISPLQIYRKLNCRRGDSRDRTRVRMEIYLGTSCISNCESRKANTLGSILQFIPDIVYQIKVPHRRCMHIKADSSIEWYIFTQVNEKKI